ncbi:DUF397 domain-containing protein [Streptomyces sp. NBC_01511]|uniref:DUF397 domain-containing protein n=1 Tax=unclassified Streptomyces TaxID=2593676 RepID=UPI0038699636
MSTTRTTWVKSSYSGTGGNNCLEWAPAHIPTTGTVPVRDSKDPAGPVLTLTPTAWATFVAYTAVSTGATR